MSIVAECCCGSAQKDRELSKTTCPQCMQEGLQVSKVTVGHLIKEPLAVSLKGEQFNVCMTPGCDIVYYGLDTDMCFTQDMVKVPIWFKQGAHPKYACYCSKITEQQVIDAVVKLGSDSLKEVIAATGAMKDSNCIEKNPLGVCCHSIIEEAMHKGKEMR